MFTDTDKDRLTNQSNTCLDVSYEELEQMETPYLLMLTKKFVPELFLPVAAIPKFDIELPDIILRFFLTGKKVDKQLNKSD